MWLALGPRSGVLQWVGGDVPLFGWHKRRPARPPGHPDSRLEATRRAEEPKVQFISLSLSPQAVLAFVQLEGSQPTSLLRTQQPQGGPHAAFTTPYSGPQPDKGQLVGTSASSARSTSARRPWRATRPASSSATTGRWTGGAQRPQEGPGEGRERGRADGAVCGRGAGRRPATH
jgi:hypothetical protein